MKGDNNNDKPFTNNEVYAIADSALKSQRSTRAVKPKVPFQVEVVQLSKKST